MKYRLILVIFLFYFSCSEKNNAKELFTEEELRILQANQDILQNFSKNWDSTKIDNLKLLLVYASKAVKLDTTRFGNIHFHFKNRHIDYSNNHEVQDSLLDVHYGIKTEAIDESEWLKIFGAEKIDSLIRFGNSSKGYMMDFQNLMNVIEKNSNYKKLAYEKAYWEEREVSFNRYKVMVQTKSYRKGYELWKESSLFVCETRDLDNITNIDPMNNRCDEFINDFCNFKNKNIYFCDYNKLRLLIYKHVYLKMDTSGMLPISISFDSLGNTQSVTSNKSKYNSDLFKAFNELSGNQQIKFLNKKLIGFTHIIYQWPNETKERKL